MKNINDTFKNDLKKGIDIDLFLDRLKDISGIEINSINYSEYINMYGLDIEKVDNIIYDASYNKNIKETTFCIVDIETNGSDSKKDQIIDIAGVKIKDYKIVDKFNSLIKCKDIPKYIEELTGIDEQFIKNAPDIESVMHDFKIFLGNSVFIAHNVNFDFDFINNTLERLNLPIMFNTKLCSIELSKKFIRSEKYGLTYLNESLGLLPSVSMHRAFNDVLVTFELFKLILDNKPKNIFTIKELINCSTVANSVELK